MMMNKVSLVFYKLVFVLLIFFRSYQGRSDKMRMIGKSCVGISLLFVLFVLSIIRDILFYISATKAMLIFSIGWPIVFICLYLNFVCFKHAFRMNTKSYRNYKILLLILFIMTFSLPFLTQQFRIDTRLFP
jgi:hypothetical protein